MSTWYGPPTPLTSQFANANDYYVDFQYQQPTTDATVTTASNNLINHITTTAGIPTTVRWPSSNYPLVNPSISPWTQHQQQNETEALRAEIIRLRRELDAEMLAKTLPPVETTEQKQTIVAPEPNKDRRITFDL